MWAMGYLLWICHNENIRHIYFVKIQSKCSTDLNAIHFSDHSNLMMLISSNLGQTRWQNRTVQRVWFCEVWWLWGTGQVFGTKAHDWWKMVWSKHSCIKCKSTPKIYIYFNGNHYDVMWFMKCTTWFKIRHFGVSVTSWFRCCQLLIINEMTLTFLNKHSNA